MRGSDADAIRAGIFNASPGSASSRTGASTDAFERAREARWAAADRMTMSELALAGTQALDIAEVEPVPDLEQTSVFVPPRPRLPPPRWSAELRQAAREGPWDYSGLGQAETGPAPAPAPSLTPGPVPWPLLLAAGAFALLLLGGGGGEQSQA